MTRTTPSASLEFVRLEPVRLSFLDARLEVELALFPRDVEGVHLVGKPRNRSIVHPIQDLQRCLNQFLRRPSELLRAQGCRGESRRTEVARPSGRLRNPHLILEV